MEMIQAAEQNKIHEWRLNREISYMIYAVNVKEEGRLTKTEFLPLPGDANATVSTTLSQRIEAWKKAGILS